MGMLNTHKDENVVQRQLYSRLTCVVLVVFFASLLFFSLPFF